MKIDGTGFTRTANEITGNRDETVKPGDRGAVTPAKIVALVKETAGKNMVTLHWDGSDHPCRVDTHVQKGEFLLLQFKGWSGKRQFFKVLARSNNAAMAEEEQTMQKSQVLIHGLKTAPLPLLFRQYKRDSLNDDREDNKLMQAEAGRTVENTLEFIIETIELGVIMIRVEPELSGYLLRLLVETGRTGKILEKGLAGLQQIISRILQEKKINLTICRWEVIPLLDIQEIKETLHKFSYLLDRKV